MADHKIPTIRLATNYVASRDEQDPVPDSESYMANFLRTGSNQDYLKGILG